MTDVYTINDMFVCLFVWVEYNAPLDTIEVISEAVWLPYKKHIDFQAQDPVADRKDRNSGSGSASNFNFLTSRKHVNALWQLACTYTVGGGKLSK